MKARIFLSYYRYYQELKCNAIESEYPPEEKRGEVKSSFDTFCISKFQPPLSPLPIKELHGHLPNSSLLLPYLINGLFCCPFDTPNYR